MKIPKDLAVLSKEAQLALRAEHEAARRNALLLRVQHTIEGVIGGIAVLCLVALLLSVVWG